MVDRSIFKSMSFCWTPQSLLNANTLNEQNFIDIPREDSVKSPKDSYFALDIIAKPAGADAMYTSGVNVNLINLGPVA